MCVAMLAVLAPLPPFWYVVEEESLEGVGGERVNVKTIDFAITEEGGVSFTAKEEQGARLMYARDLDDKITHSQKEHPSDEFWRKITQGARASSEFLSETEKFKVSVLPFFNQKATRGEKLFYYNFTSSKPVFASSTGEFEAFDGKGGGGKLKFPGEVGGQKGYFEKRRRATINQFKSKKRHSTIFKYTPSKELRKGVPSPKNLGRTLLNVSISSPLLLPPIPASIKEEGEEQNGLLGVEHWMLGEEGEGVVEEEERRIAEEVERPRTTQDEKRLVKGSLFVGFSGMKRPLNVAKQNLMNGRGGTPWQEREREVAEEDFEGLVYRDVYQGKEKRGGDGELL